MSLPSRERGLKSSLPFAQSHIDDVAPLAGAWIEIIVCRCLPFVYIVAPLAGAWIEIINDTKLYEKLHRSLPSRERGLKFLLIMHLIQMLRSLPSRERGLKYKRLGSLTVHDLSLPSRERGLKLMLS